MRSKPRLRAGVLALVLLLALTGCGGYQELEPDYVSFSPVPTAAPSSTPLPSPTPSDTKGNTPSVEEDGVYDSKEDVALYLYTYGCLPDNYITKDEAQDLGWSGGSLEDYAPGMCIGGDRFGNREGLLPEANGRTWSECDIDTLGEDSRGAKRIVWSNDGLIYYTDDHYESFEELQVGEER